jgi:ubiquinone/menaquinone biosynthesis C-methylase UbiE
LGNESITVDAYERFAERYDWGHKGNPAREEFFRQLFAEQKVTTVLDCACGTGRDLIMFHSLGRKVCGSDLSSAMLAQCRKNLIDAKLDISVCRADFCRLPEHHDAKFDAVVCLTSAVNEVLEDEQTLRALRSMRSVLCPGGVLVFTSGAADAKMRDRPAFDPILNNRDFTRLFTMEYSGSIMTIQIFEFAHTAHTSDFNHWSVRLLMRSQDSWAEILQNSGFSEFEFYGDLAKTPYNPESSGRLICVAKN